jgi:hypothetical protein
VCSFLLLAFEAEPFRPPAGAGVLDAGGLDGVGHAVVLTDLPHGRIPVVLAAVMDSHPDAEGQGGLALGEVAVADAVGASAGTPKVGLSRSKACSLVRSTGRWSSIQSSGSNSSASAASW